MNELPELEHEDLPEEIDETPTTLPPSVVELSAAKQKDKDLYDQWKKTGSKQDLANLLKVLQPIISKEVNKQSGSLPKQVLEAEAKKWAIEAIRSYNPAGGAALSTWVWGRMGKLNRLNYKNQNMVRLSEEWQMKYRPFQQAHANLTEQLNREPTHEELASELGWKTSHIKKLKGMLYEDHYESGNAAPVAAHTFDFEKTKFDYIMGHMDDQEKHIMKSLMRPDGKRQSAAELAGELNINQNRLSYLKTRLKKKIRSHQQELGEWD